MAPRPSGSDRAASASRRGALALAAAPFVGLGCGPADDGPAVATCADLAYTLVDTWAEPNLPPYAPDGNVLTGIALGDIDGDGWLDALFAYLGGSMGLRNDGTGRLVPDDAITVDGGPIPGAAAVALADLDGDGDLDGYLGLWEGQLDRLIRNDGAGRFTSEPLEGSEGATFTGAFGDADGDGRLDLFLGAGIQQPDRDAILDGTGVGDPNRLYLQGADGRMELALDRLPEDSLYGMTFQGSWLDADDDGDLDVYVANDVGMYLDPNHLLLNDGRGYFTRSPDCGCELEVFSMGAGVGDADADGRPDLYVSDIGPPHLLINLGGGQFVDAGQDSGAAIPATPSSMSSWGDAFADFDLDGCMDMVITYGQSGAGVAGLEGLDDPDWQDGPEQPDVLLRGGCDGTFTQWQDTGFADPSRTRAVAVGDLDRDGRPDMVTAGLMFLKVWRASGGCGGGVTLTLDAGPGNRQGIGSRVDVTVGDRVTTQWMLPSTTGSSSAPELYLGLGLTPSADEVRVTWPDGEVMVVKDVAAGSALAVTR